MLVLEPMLEPMLMRERIPETARRQMLADMKIDVWHLRVDGAQVQTEAPAVPASPVVAAAPESPAPPVPVVQAKSSPPPTPPPSAPPTTAPIVEPVPLVAMSVAVPGTVLLLDGAPSRRDLRLAVDLLAAASGDWRAKPVSRQFVWPPSGAVGGFDTGADAGPRALQAFVGKDVTDHHAKLLMVARPLADALGDIRGLARRLVIPVLAELGGDASAKRSVWQALRAPAPSETDPSKSVPRVSSP